VDGHPDRRRISAGLRGKRLVRHLRPEEHACRDDKLNKEVNAGLADPKIKARFADLGATVIPGSPADFGKLIADETEKWGQVIRAANIKPS
jgi:tripartite-type tricarboxylate transporter receptor subunit TctC